MADRYSSHARAVYGPASAALAITPSDATTLDATSGLYVGGAGNLTVEMLDGGTVTLTGVQGGSVLPLRVVRVLASTTATNIVGLLN
ncbi:hypothetical protein SAMN06297144_1859 [Sphingomonas guangdongensis]|uniref:Uncharacterized protein n=1 Tax=Sphingomonas guangdongensis TaxID=1141890 RepID=A0A285QXQ7_9SPHN|nr:hypothetical protein [Sphingomonas guangdongensis]SOB86750.1 hypothetical protein SAMN06297144_1859 [Sphingomonas guangdongensis]